MVYDLCGGDSMSIDPITAVMSLGESVIKRIWPNPSERAQHLHKLEALRQEGRLEELQAEVSLLLAQLKVNEEQAKHKSLFVAGARPAAMWICVAILAFNYIVVPVASIWYPVEMTDMTDLWPVLLGMLGIGGMRSYDKRNGVQTDSLK